MAITTTTTTTKKLSSLNWNSFFLLDITFRLPAVEKYTNLLELFVCKKKIKNHKSTSYFSFPFISTLRLQLKGQDSKQKKNSVTSIIIMYVCLLNDWSFNLHLDDDDDDDQITTNFFLLFCLFQTKIILWFFLVYKLILNYRLLLLLLFFMD